MTWTLEEETAYYQLMDDLSAFAQKLHLLSPAPVESDWSDGITEAARFYVKAVYSGRTKPEWGYQRYRIRNRMKTKPAALLASLHDEYGRATPQGLWKFVCNKDVRRFRKPIHRKRIQMYNWYIKYSLPIQLTFYKPGRRTNRKLKSKKVYKLPRRWI